MKKIILLVFSFIIVISLCACSNKADTNEPTVEQDEITTTAPQNEKQDVTEENKVMYAEEEFSYEAVCYEAVGPYSINVDFKFRNITEKDIDRIAFSAQGLDANGDVVEDTVLGAENISADQAAWFTYQTNSTRSSQSIEDLSQKIHSVKVTSVYVCVDENDFNTEYNLDFKEPIIITVADVEDKEAVNDQANNTNISDVLVASEWHRTDASGETVATMTFAEDETGVMMLVDDESYEFKWSIGDNNTVEVILSVDGNDAPGSYNFLNENGKYSIQMVDDSSFTYYAK